MNIRVLLLALIAICAGGEKGSAQDYPSRPITIVVPFAAGGPTDAIVRVLAEHMKNSLGRPLIIENIGGGSGTIGISRVIRSASDGYTLGIGHWGTHVLLGAVYPVPYDTLRDLEPIGLVSHNPQMIVSKNSVPAKDLRELIGWIKAHPLSVVQGTTGAGSAPHVAGVLLQNLTGTTYRFVPYRGGAPAMQDLIAGHIDLMITQAASGLQQVRDGKIRAYAVTAATRIAAAPEIATVDEMGLPGLHTSLWHAFWAPAGTPGDVIAKLNRAIVAALSDPDVRKRLEVHLGQDIPPREQQTPEALRALHKAEIARWWPIIKAAGIKGE